MLQSTSNSWVTSEEWEKVTLVNAAIVMFH